MRRSETYAHAKPQDSAGKSCFFFSVKGGVCSALALSVYRLSAPQVSIHYLKICSANPSGLFRNRAGGKVCNWQTAEGAVGKNRHMERCEPSELRSQPTRLFRLFWPPADKGTARKHKVTPPSLSLSLCFAFTLFNNGLLFFISFQEVQTI